MVPLHVAPDQDRDDNDLVKRLQSLCRPCHFAKTAQEHRARLNLSPAEIRAADRWKRLVDELA